MQGALVNYRIIVIAVVLTVVASEMLEAGDHIPALDSFDSGDDKFSGKVRILAVVFEETPSQRVTEDVAGRAEKHGPAQGPGFLSPDSTDLVHQVSVPGGCGSQSGREAGDNLPVSMRSPSAVGHLQRRNAKARDTRIAMTKIDLLFKCQVVEYLHHPFPVP